MLAEIGVTEATPRIEAWNKLDLLDTDRRAEVIAETQRRDDVVAVSALDGEGVDHLLARVAERLTEGHRRYRITLDTADGAGAAWLHANGEVMDQAQDEDGDIAYDVRLSSADYERFTRRA